MAVWRRRVLELFPDLRREFQRRQCSICSVFFHLLPLVREAHDTGDVDLARRIFSFAEWCLDQKGGEVSNASAVAFYEHLFDEKPYWPLVIPWLSRNAIEGCWPLWEFRLPPEELAELRELIANRARRG
jgi:hypothetical protein